MTGLCRPHGEAKGDGRQADGICGSQGLIDWVRQAALNQDYETDESDACRRRPSRSPSVQTVVMCTRPAAQGESSWSGLCPGPRWTAKVINSSALTTHPALFRVANSRALDSFLAITRLRSSMLHCVAIRTLRTTCTGAGAIRSTYAQGPPSDLQCRCRTTNLHGQFLESKGSRQDVLCRDNRSGDFP